MKTSISRSIPVDAQYPRLMESHYSHGKVVLFDKSGCGMVVSSGDDSKHPVGHYSTEWSMNSFKPFHGVVHLDSEK